MILLQRRLEALALLGKWLSDFIGHWPESLTDEDASFAAIIEKAHHYNQWMVGPFLVKSLQHWSTRLSADSLRAFAARYPELENGRVQKTVAILPKENIPLNGFHDLICILLAGHRFVCRNINHSADALWYISQKLIALEPAWKDDIFWDDRFPKTTDKYLVHASHFGSQTWREYMQKKDSLIRNHTISVAIITPEDKAIDFELLGCDVFDFFGQSSYNVRKLFVPETFSIEAFFPEMEKYAFVYQYNRYANNYDYQRSVLMMDQKPFFENGFLVLRETAEHTVPIGCLHYEVYTSDEELKFKMNSEAAHIQQIVTNATSFPNSVKPGTAMAFQLNDFEDHQDTMRFLL